MQPLTRTPIVTITMGELRRYASAAACAVAIALLLAACSGSTGRGSSYGSGDPNLAAANPGRGPTDPFLTNGDAVLSALDAVTARSGRPLRVTSISADQMNGLMVDVQEPEKHARAFDPHAIAFAKLTPTVREAIAKSNYPDARVIEWEFGGIGPDDRKYIYLESARARPVAVVNPQLKIVRMQF